jgi:EAL domain-containing protein (putative c-di-GMP-specific phosphodiesterase class I)
VRGAAILGAEAVELPAQAMALLAQGCDQAQGYLYGRAMPAADAIDFIASHVAQASLPLARTA